VRNLEFSLELFDADALTAALRDAGFTEIRPSTNTASPPALTALDSSRSRGVR
jgi:hypothetical protein